MTDGGLRTGTTRKVTLAALAVPVGAVLAWLTFVAATYVPTDNIGLGLGLPVLILAAAGWLTFRRAPSFAVMLVSSGLLALTLMVWVLWQFGQGMENFD
jgi:hypothetical protein